MKKTSPFLKLKSLLIQDGHSEIMANLILTGIFAQFNEKSGIITQELGFSPIHEAVYSLTNHGYSEQRAIRLIVSMLKFSEN